VLAPCPPDVVAEVIAAVHAGPGSAATEYRLKISAEPAWRLRLRIASWRFGIKFAILHFLRFSLSLSVRRQHLLETLAFNSLRRWPRSLSCQLQLDLRSANLTSGQPPTDVAPSELSNRFGLAPSRNSTKVTNTFQQRSVNTTPLTLTCSAMALSRYSTLTQGNKPRRQPHRRSRKLRAPVLSGRDILLTIQQRAHVISGPPLVGAWKSLVGNRIGKSGQMDLAALSEITDRVAEQPNSTLHAAGQPRPDQRHSIQHPASPGLSDPAVARIQFLHLCKAPADERRIACWPRNYLPSIAKHQHQPKRQPDQQLDQPNLYRSTRPESGRAATLGSRINDHRGNNKSVSAHRPRTSSASTN